MGGYGDRHAIISAVWFGGYKHRWLEPEALSFSPTPTSSGQSQPSPPIARRYRSTDREKAHETTHPPSQDNMTPSGLSAIARSAARIVTADMSPW